MMIFIVGFILGVIGFAYIVYAKKSSTLSFAISGAALTVVSFLPVSSVYVFIIAVALIIFPFVVRF